MNGLNTVLIVVGLFLIGGVISFVKQGLPKGLIALRCFNLPVAPSTISRSCMWSSENRAAARRNRRVT